MDYFLCVMGMVMIVEGLPYFAFPEKMKVWLERLQEMPNGVMRKVGFFMMLAGLSLVYLGKG
ncbi:MAG: DUF2065 domain-containing protein [Desulfatirhabdiaceae bacterium]